MPEGVEVKLSSELIKPLTIDKIVKKLSIGATSRYSKIPPNGYAEFSKSIENNLVKIVDISVKGKFMYWSFDNGWHMFCTYGMTGQMSPQAGKHICLSFQLNDATTGDTNQVFFNDPRHFGTVKFTNNRSVLLDKLHELGWDPLSNSLDKHLPSLKYRIHQSNKPISQLLMDQSLFAGVGNYIKSEALYESKLSPWRAGNSLSEMEIILLCTSIIEVMKTSYNHQGATIQTYKTPYGEEGRYSSLFKVYSKKTDPLGNKIITETTPDKRTTHWVPAIQK